jgi:hypothetical protein
LRAVKIFPNITEPSLPCSHDAETDRNYVSNYILFNSQGGMTVNLLGWQPLKVLLPIPNITDKAIWIMSRMVINRRNCHYVHNTSNMDYPGIEPRLPL